VTRPLPEFSWTTQSPQATSPSIIVRHGMQSSAASHVFGPSTTQVDPDIPYREGRQTSHWHHTEDSSTLHWFPRGLNDSVAPSEVREVLPGTVRPTVGVSSSVIAASRAVNVDRRVERSSLPHLLLVTRVADNFRPSLRRIVFMLMCVQRRHLCRVVSIAIRVVSGFTQPHTRPWLRLRRRSLIYCVMSMISCRRLVAIATIRLRVSVKTAHRCWVLVCEAPLGYHSIARQRALTR